MQSICIFCKDNVESNQTTFSWCQLHASERTIKGPFRVHFPTDKVHFVTLCSGKTKKGSAALNRAILGPPLPYPIEVLDERQKKKAAGMEKTLQWQRQYVTEIIAQGHTIEQMLPQKSFQEKKKVGDKKGRLPFVLFFIQRGKEF